jgi:hypothetical protein
MAPIKGGFVLSHAARKKSPRKALQAGRKPPSLFMASVWPSFAAASHHRITACEMLAKALHPERFQKNEGGGW